MRLAILFTLLLTAACAAQEIDTTPADTSQTMTLTANGQTYVRRVFGLSDNLNTGWHKRIGNVHYGVTADELRSLRLDSKDVIRQFRDLQVRAEVNNPVRNELGLSEDEYRLMKSLARDWKRNRKVNDFIQVGGSYRDNSLDWTRDWSLVQDPPSNLNDRGKRAYHGLIAKARRHHEKEQAEIDAIERAKGEVGQELFAK